MNLRDLKYVLAVAKHRNFTRASESVSVSQPALSNQIKKLEAELGIPIFERNRDGISLTAFGEELMLKAEQIVDLSDSISDLARAHKSSAQPPLRLAMTPTLAAYLSPYFKDIFAKIVPDRKIVIVEEYPVAISNMVENRSVDFAFIARKSYDTIYHEAKQPMAFMPLWLEPLYLGVRRDHPISQKGSIWAHEVPADRLIRFPISFGYDLEKDLPEPSEKVAEEIGIDVSTARFETVCRYVAQNDACTIVNAIAAEQFKLDDFGLSFVPFNDAGNMRELGVLSRPQYPNPEIVNALEQHVRTEPPFGTVGIKSSV